MSEVPGIPVIVGDSAPAPSDQDLLSPRAATRAKPELKYLDTEKLKAGVNALCHGLRDVFEGAREVGQYELSEVTIGLEISAEGQVFLIGKAGVKGALELKFSPRKDA